MKRKKPKTLRIETYKQETEEHSFGELQQGFKKLLIFCWILAIGFSSWEFQQEPPDPQISIPLISTLIAFSIIYAFISINLRKPLAQKLKPIERSHD